MIKMPYIWGERGGNFKIQRSSPKHSRAVSHRAETLAVSSHRKNYRLLWQLSPALLGSVPQSKASLKRIFNTLTCGSDMAGCCQVPGRPLIKDTLLGCLETFVGSSRGTACPLRVSWMDVLSSMQVYKGRLSRVSSECSFWLLVPHHKSRLLIFIS